MKLRNILKHIPLINWFYKCEVANMFSSRLLEIHVNDDDKKLLKQLLSDKPHNPIAISMLKEIQKGGKSK